MSEAHTIPSTASSVDPVNAVGAAAGGAGGAGVERPRRKRRSRPVSDVPARNDAAGRGALAGTATSLEPVRAMQVGARVRRPPRGMRELHHALHRGLQSTVSYVLLALFLWIALAALVYATRPDNVLALGAFFLAMFGALFFTLAPVLRAVALRCTHSRLYQQASRQHAARQAVMLSVFVVLNALLQMVRAWTALTALLLFGMFAVIEVVALARR